MAFLVEQELPTCIYTLSEDLSLAIVFNEIRVAQSLVFCTVFCRSLFVLFGHCSVHPC